MNSSNTSLKTTIIKTKNEPSEEVNNGDNNLGKKRSKQAEAQQQYIIIMLFNKSDLHNSFLVESRLVNIYFKYETFPTRRFTSKVTQHWR